LSNKSQFFAEHVVFILASRRINFYKIPIFGDNIVPPKHFFFVMGAALGWAAKKLFI
jgi:hypothetical protein